MTDYKLYGLIGYPLGHSFSQHFFNSKFESEGINARYCNFELPDIGDLMELVSEYPNLCGFNVTIPYKELIIPYLDSQDDISKRIGAVNVVKVSQCDGEPVFTGYNTDVIGFSKSIKPLLKSHHCKALVLGTGGASKAVCYSLLQLGVEPIVVSRSADKVVMTYADITLDVINENTIIVNTTPCGMYPDVESCPDIPYELLTSRHLCYDLVYNPDETLFIRKAAAQGAETKGGMEMLELQAMASWDIWQR